ncbi:MAG: fused MFS/spermidine synthase [Minisyncoccus archaeiphilus]|uniref:spermidine synthase n=1 Tax=Minisyncoccus archaeiphilus TaxID=3238481 RepID=UPI0009C6CFE9|nr:MAG: spermidine synthase [Parcubacteria group bacterium ADurb.Bin216]GMX59721.1 MAG: fused MFS/spermidine synthase [Candidatus Parcubacteria bacterium]
MKIDHLLEISVFICGAIVMIFELCGSRILSPFLGTSIFVWTSLIGVVMGSLSAGYYYGGIIADKNPNYKSFGRIMLISGILIIASFLFKEIIPGIFSEIKKLEISSLLSSLFLFAPASFFLGMISPYAAKLKSLEIKDLKKDIGKTVGNLYAISTAGSIFGTFLAGYFLIPFFGTTTILFSIGIILIIFSLIITPLKNQHLFALITFALISYSTPLMLFNEDNIVLEVDSLYDRIFVTEDIHYQTKRPLLYIMNNSSGIQSGMFADKDDDLVFEYTRFYRLGDHFNPNIENALMIGGCGYSYPKDFLKSHPGKKMDVVEIDEAMTKIAEQYFHLDTNHPDLNIYHEDGRTFLNRNNKKYDAIYIDAFNSATAIPYQLTTQESMKKKYDSLNEEGVMIMNIIASINGPKSKFLQAEYKTVSSIFPQTYVFPLHIENEKTVQNIVMIGIKSDKKPSFNNPDPELNRFLSMLYKKEISTNIAILTDDFAPVEYYLNN